MDETVESVLRDICLDSANRYEIAFLAIGADKDHVHFLVQSVPTSSPTQIARRVKSITAREVVRPLPQLKQRLWGGAFWTSGFFISTVGRHRSEAVIRHYVQKQGRGAEYQVLHVQQLGLFEVEEGASLGGSV